MKRLTRLMGIVALATAMVAGSCSSDDGVDDGVDDAASSSTTTTADVSSDTTPTPARASAGCAAPDDAQVTAERVELVVGGQARHYLVTTPPPHGDRPAPLVLDLHGLLEGAEIHAQHSRLGEFGQEHDFITVFPHGTGEPVSWDIRTGADDNADLAYLDTLVERVTARRCVDEARIYATGLSNGAMMVSSLLCERSERFAAVAPVDGIAAPEPCEQERPVPILTTHGTADPILLFNGGVGDLSTFLGDEDGTTGTATTAAPGTTVDLDGDGYPATVRTWAERNGCGPEPTEDRLGESILHRTYDCPAGADVEFVIVEGGGHTWPGSEFSVDIESITGPTTFEIDWNELMWDFFQRHSLG